MNSQDPNESQNSNNNGSPNPSPNNGSSTPNEPCDCTSGNSQIGYPDCPPQLEQEKADPVFVPITMEICPIVNLKINKPKICVQNQANTKPTFFLD